MISYLNKAKSLGNLYRAEIGGQVATILLFMIVVVLALVMFTVNIGNLSLSTTVLSNAVDQASLYLASELSTRSRILFETLGNDTKYCKKRGLVAFVGSLLLGPLGGAVGGLIDGSGFWEGLSQGFFTAIRFAGALIIGSTFGWIGAAIMGALDIGAEIYNYVKNDHAAVHGMRQIAENISKLDLPLQYREETYYRVLSQIVDDPNMFPDDADADGDGNRKELVNGFEDFFFWRTEQLAENYANRINMAVRRFIVDPNTNPPQGQLKLFRDFAEKHVSAPTGSNNDNGYSKDGYLARCDFTNPSAVCPPFNPYDGVIIYLARGLSKWGHTVAFWRTGQPALYCKGEKPWTCPDSDAHDSIDRVTATFTTLIADADEKIIKIKERPGSLSELAKIWPEWLSIFYYYPGNFKLLNDHGFDLPEEGDKGPGGYYFELGNLIDCNMGCGEGDYFQMDKWEQEINDKRKELTNVCHTTITDTKDPNYGKCLGPATIGSKPCNVPCCINNNTVCTVDPILDDPDEFDRAIDATKTIIDRMNVFRGEISDFYNELLTVYTMEDKSAGIDGGGNPMIYLWNDARCPKGKNDFCHSVRVDILDSEGKNAINVPYLKYTKSWRQVCLKLRNGAGVATVQVTRQDPTNVMVGILGKWNPFSKLFKGVVRRSTSRYSYEEKDAATGRRIPYIKGIK